MDRCSLGGSLRKRAAWVPSLVLLHCSALADTGPSSPFVEPEGVTEQLRTVREQTSLYGPWLPGGYRDWKISLREGHNLDLGLLAFINTQKASADGEDEEDSAAGGIYRLQGAWRLFQPASADNGRLEFRVEYRAAHFGEPSPTDLSGELGIRANGTGFLYNDDFDLDLSVLNWTQIFNEGRAGFALGRLPFDAHQDPFALQTANGPLLNTVFVLNPTMPVTGIGALGGVIKGMVSEHVWLGVQAYDANAQNGKFDLDTVQENEWQKAVEIGWTPSLAQRRFERIQFTYWHKDSRDEAGIESGDGWAMTAAGRLTDNFLGFLRYGHSDGGAGVAARNSASTGFRYSLRRFDELSFGLGWSEPSDRQLDDEYAAELSYRIHLAPELSLMPDLQWVKDPAANPEEDHIWVFSLRTVLSL